MSFVLTTEVIANNVNAANVGNSWKGDTVKAINYFIAPKSITTVNYSNTGVVSGNVVIQGSLELDPTDDKDWVDVLTIDFSNAAPQSIQGNWFYMRGKADDFTSGIINISITY